MMRCASTRPGRDAVDEPARPAGRRVSARPCLVGSALADGCYIDLHEDPAVHERNLTASDDVRGRLDGSQPCDPGKRRTRRALEQGAGQVTHGDVLCEWAGGYEEAGGETRPVMGLVNVNDEGAPVSVCGATLGSLYDHISGGAYRAVSADGDTCVLHGPRPPAGSEARRQGRLLEPQRRTEPGEAPEKRAAALHARQKTEPGGEAVYETLKVSAPELA